MLDHRATADGELGAPAPFVGLLRGHYGVIEVDPPSRFLSRTAIQSRNWKSRRDTERHYKTMTLAELMALPVGKLAAPSGCHLFLWTSAPFVPQALQLITAWEFKFSSFAFTWIKLRRGFDANQLCLLPLAEWDLHFGLGLTTRKNSEICLLGRRGSPRRLAKNVPEIIFAPVREHSRKPIEAIARIERYGAGPYATLFARSARKGWDAWGDELEKFGEDKI